jgi:hypothetical protein
VAAPAGARCTKEYLKSMLLLLLRVHVVFLLLTDTAAAATAAAAGCAAAGCVEGGAIATIAPASAPPLPVGAIALVSAPITAACAGCKGATVSGCDEGGAGDASRDSTTTTSSAPSQPTPVAAEISALSVARGAGAAGGRAAVLGGCKPAFELRLAFLLANSARVTWRRLTNGLIAAMVLFWLGAGASGGLRRPRP